MGQVNLSTLSVKCSIVLGLVSSLARGPTLKLDLRAMGANCGCCGLGVKDRGCCGPGASGITVHGPALVQFSAHGRVAHGPSIYML